MSPDETARRIVEAHVAAGYAVADEAALIAAIASALREAGGVGFHRLAVAERLAREGPPPPAPEAQPSDLSWPYGAQP